MYFELNKSQSPILDATFNLPIFTVEKCVLKSPPYISHGKYLKRLMLTALFWYCMHILWLTNHIVEGGREVGVLTKSHTVIV